MHQTDFVQLHAAYREACSDRVPKLPLNRQETRINVYLLLMGRADSAFEDVAVSHLFGGFFCG